MNRRIDISVLQVLSARPDAVTYVIRNTLVMRSYGFHFSSILKTREVRLACRRLQNRGLVAEAPTSYAVMKCWKITDAGRELLSRLKEEGR